MPRLIPARHELVHRITIRLQGPSPASANSALVYSATSTDPTDSAGVALRANAVWRASFVPGSNQWRYVGVSVVTYGGIPGAVTSAADVDDPVTGSDTQSVLPPGCCLLLRKVVAKPVGERRTPKGHFYMPGIPEVTVDAGGFITSATKTAYDSGYSAVLVSLNAAAGVGTRHVPVLEWANMTDVNYKKAPILSISTDLVMRNLRSRALRS